MRLGRDVEVVSKQSSKLVEMFRRELLLVNEDFRLAGRELARAVKASIAGTEAKQLQTLFVPDKVLGANRSAQISIPDAVPQAAPEPHGPLCSPGASVRSNPWAPKKSRCAWIRFAVPRACRIASK